MAPLASDSHSWRWRWDDPHIPVWPGLHQHQTFSLHSLTIKTDVKGVQGLGPRVAPNIWVSGPPVRELGPRSVSSSSSSPKRGEGGRQKGAWPRTWHSSKARQTVCPAPGRPWLFTPTGPPPIPESSPPKCSYAQSCSLQPLIDLAPLKDPRHLTPATPSPSLTLRR